MPALFVLVGGLLGGAGFLFYFLTVRGNYEASAVLKYETSVAGYRRLASVAFSPEGFSAWAAAERGAIDPQAASELRRTLGDSSLAARAIAPFFRVTKRDLRDMPPTKEDEQLISQLLGVQLGFNGRSPAEAVELVRLSAIYLRDIALWDQASDFVRANLQKYSNDAARAQNELLRKLYEASELETKVKELRKLRASYPESDKQNSRQLLSVGDDGKASIYLSPLVQVVGAESELIELRRIISRNRREYEKARIASAYFQRAIKDVTEPNSGLDLLTKLEARAEDIKAENSGLDPDAIREISNEIGRALSELRVIFVQQPLFLTGEHIAVQRFASWWKISLLGALGGALAVTFILALPRLVRLPAVPTQRTGAL